MAKSAAVAEVTEAPAEVTTEEVIDLSQFEVAVEAAVSGADESTGAPSEVLVAGVRDAYQALPGIKAKNEAKKSLNDSLKAFITDQNIVGARTIMVLNEEAAVAGKSAAPKKEVNHREAFVSKVAGLTLALYLASQDVPEGVEDGDVAVSEATTAANDAFAEATEVMKDSEKETESALIKAAVKLATTKARKSGTRVSGGERRDLGAHISEAFDAAESGQFLTVAAIRKFESTIYGTEHPSAGAITNRLEPKSGNGTTIEGITVGKVDGKLGATKN